MTNSRVEHSFEKRVTGHGGNPPGQGPFMRVSLTLAGETILEASFETYQCPGCVACGNAIVSMVKGKTLAAAGAIRHEDLVNRVGPLARHRQICYGLTILALDDALKQSCV